jgi:hypothetical protein
MAQITVNYPVPGDPNSTEDQKVLTALQTLVNTINSLDNANLTGTAGIEGSKLANTSISASKLASNAVEESKILADAVTAEKLRDSADTDANRAVTTNHIRNSAVTTEKVADSAITTAKLSTPTTDTATNDASVGAGTVTARRYTDGLVILEGGLIKGSGTWAAGDTIATLPAGFRPAQSTSACVWVSSATGATRITIDTAGVISVTSGLLSGVAAAAIDCNGVVFQGA